MIWFLSLSATLFMACSAVERPDRRSSVHGSLPKAVAETIEQRFRGAKLLRVSNEINGSGKLLKISIEQGAMERQVYVRPTGELLSFEQRIPFAELPEMVADKIYEVYPDARKASARKVTSGTFTLYAVKLKRRGGIMVEVWADDAGRLLPPSPASPESR